MLKKGLENIVNKIIKFRWLILIIVTIITALSITQFKKLVVYNEIDIWVQKSSEEFQNYQEFTEHFGLDESVFLFLHSDSIFSNKYLKLNYTLTDSLQAIDGVSKVISLATIKVPFRTSFGTKMIPLLPKSTRNSQKLKERILVYDSFKNYVISNDGSTAVFAVFMEPNANRKQILSQVSSIEEEILPKYGETAIYGIAPLKQELNDLSSSESKFFLLISIIVMILINFLIFRRLKEAFMPLLIAIITICWIVGLLALMQVKVNVVISALPLILLVVSTAFSVHFISGFITRLEEEKDKKTATIKNFSKTVINCFLSALTTAIALLAFTLSDITPLVHFGIFSALGVMIAFLLSFSVLPIIYSFVGVSHRKSVVNSSHELKFTQLTLFISRNKKIIYIISLVVLIFSITGISKIKVHSNQIDYFKQNNPIQISLKKVSSWMSGVYPIELILNLNKSIYEEPNYYLPMFRELEEKFSQREELQSWQSPYLMLNDFGLIDTITMKLIPGLQSQFKSDKSLKRYISEDGKTIKISIRTAWLTDAQTLSLITLLGEDLKEVLSNNESTFHFTGSAQVFAHLSERLVRSQIKTVLVAFLMIIIVFLFIYRSFRFALLCTIPNILPVAFTLGVMGFLKIPLDVATVLLASVSLGIAIDDTIHFVSAFKESSINNDRKQSITKAYIKVGKPLIATTTLLIGGFIVMVFSSYRPILYLGAFISLNVVLALIYDLILLPAILLYQPKRLKN